MKAQEYLDLHYPKEERKNIQKLDINKKALEGHLDLSDFINLEELDFSSSNFGFFSFGGYVLDSHEELIEKGVNQITSLNISKNKKLKIILCHNNKISANLSIFSHLADLKKLDLGTKTSNNWNNFIGSLKDLENCKKLEYLCIGSQSDIVGWLEYLPLDNLKFFGCYGTEYQNMLRPYDYDIKAWKLVNHPEMFTNLGELIKQKLEQSKKDLETVKKANSHRPSHEVKRIARLESKIQKLKTGDDYQATLTKSFSSMELKEKTNKVEKKPIHLHHWLDTARKPNHIQAEIEIKKREIKREYELLENKRKEIDYKRDRSDGLSFLMEDKWEEDLNRHHKRIKSLEEEIKQIELQFQIQISSK